LRVLLTAFEPYDEWSQNSSWLALVELLKDRPTSLELVTRRYPVDLKAVRGKLPQDLSTGFDAVLHLGQSPGATSLKLEAIALNVAGCMEKSGEVLKPIVEQGPLAYSSQMPLARWAQLLRESAIPASVSYHAGTFLCNATMYLTHHFYNRHDRQTPVGFIHLPLVTEQVANSPTALPSLSTQTLAQGLRLLLEDLAASAATPMRSQSGSNFA
jgi:pyroglutamyl-peptidase